MNEKSTGWHHGVKFQQQVSDDTARAEIEGTGTDTVAGSNNELGAMLGAETDTCECGLPLDQCVDNGGEGLGLFGDDVRGESPLGGVLGAIFSINDGPSEEDVIRQQKVEYLINTRSAMVGQTGRILEMLTKATLQHQEMVEQLASDIEDDIDGQW